MAMVVSKVWPTLENSPKGGCDRKNIIANGYCVSANVSAKAGLRLIVNHKAIKIELIQWSKEGRKLVGVEPKCWWC